MSTPDTPTVVLVHGAFADAPEVGKKALETVLSRLASDASAKPPPGQPY